MLKRCYNEKALTVNDTYRKVTVCDEWRNFEKFYDWYSENYYEIEGEVMCLDKDILNKNSNIYSPETCVFTPKTINNSFPKCDKSRGEYPIGVRWIKSDRIFGAACRIGNNDHVWLGRFHSQIDAFNAYKNFKEKHIKELADRYKNVIPKRLYDGLYNYIVEITD